MLTVLFAGIGVAFNFKLLDNCSRALSSRSSYTLFNNTRQEIMDRGGAFPAVFV
jgi:hypothetical protein